MVQIPELILVSWVSLGNYDRPPLSVRELGRRLGVSQVLDGGVRRADDRVRVTARLLESTGGRQIWAERFDRRLGDIFTLQDEITQIHLLNREHKQALAASEQALKVRPNCHASFAVRAGILNYTVRPAEAVELARYAIRLCPVYPAFYATVLATAYYGCGMYAAAVEAAMTNLDSDPNNLDALLILAAANAALQRFEQAQEAIRAIRRAKPDFSPAKYADSQPYQDSRNVDHIISMLKKAGI